MVDKLMYILNVDTQNYPFCNLQSLIQMFRTKQSISIKVVKPTNRKRNYKTLWTSVKNSPM